MKPTFELDRPPLVECRGVIAVEPDALAPFLLDVTVGPPGRGRVALLDGDHPGGGEVRRIGEGRYTASAAGYPLTIDVDAGGRAIATQGGWWYRGEYLLRAHPRGTELRHRVRNVATSARWAVPLANRLFIGLAERTRRALDARLDDLAQRANSEVVGPARIV